ACPPTGRFSLFVSSLSACHRYLPSCPTRRSSDLFTPPMRRAVEIFEAACIAAVLPLALAVMGLYSTLRHLDIGCWNKPTAPRLPGGSRAFGSDDATTLGTGAGCGKRRCRTDTPAA